MDTEALLHVSTSLHFGIDQPDRGHGEDGIVHGSLAAWHKTHNAPSKYGLPRNRRGETGMVSAASCKALSAAARAGVGIVTDERMKKTCDMMVAMKLLDQARLDMKRTCTVGPAMRPAMGRAA